MALTATASKNTHDKVYRMLGMCKPVYSRDWKGRTDDLCCALLYHTPRDYRVISKEMIDYCTDTTICKRQLLFQTLKDAMSVSVVNVTVVIYV